MRPFLWVVKWEDISWRVPDLPSASRASLPASVGRNGTLLPSLTPSHSPAPPPKRTLCVASPPCQGWQLTHRTCTGSPSASGHGLTAP